MTMSTVTTTGTTGTGTVAGTAAVVREYARLARVYDAKWRFYIAESTRKTEALLALQPGETVLDIGCGTGALLRQLAQSHPPQLLSGVDPVPEMLALARGKLAAEVDLREGWAESLPYPDASFDAVASCNVLHYLASPEKALREMLRVLRPGGRLALTDWCDDFLACRLCALWLRISGRARVRIYDSGECAAMLQNAGCEVGAVSAYKINWLWGLMSVAAAAPASEKESGEKTAGGRFENLICKSGKNDG